MLIGVRATSILIAGLGILSAGCRDTQPPPAHFVDLGDDRPLLPVPPAWHNPAVEKGTAEWIPFRAPGSEPARSAGQDDGAAASGDSAGLGEAEKAEIEAEIRTMIEDYNQLAAERDIPELLKFHLPEQRSTLEPLLDMGSKMLDDLRAFRGSLEEKLPDAGPRIEAVYRVLDDPESLHLKVSELTVLNDAEATGKLPAGELSPTVRFVVLEDEWFIEFPGLPSFDQLKPVLEAKVGAFGGASTALQAGGADAAEQVLAQLEGIVAMANQTPDSKPAEVDETIEAPETPDEPAEPADAAAPETPEADDE